MYFIKIPGTGHYKDTFIIRIIPTLVLFIILVVLSIWNSQIARQAIHDQEEQIVAQKTQSIRNSIQERLNVYEDILRAGTGFTYASTEITRNEWQKFVEAFDISQRYPGIQGVAVVRILQPEELAAHEQAVRAEGLPAYKVFPEGSRSVYSSIVFIEPMNEKNQLALGFDMFTNQERAAAMEQARDTGKLASTGKLTLIQDSKESGQQGFIIYQPVYRTKNVPETVEARRQNITGYVSAAFRIENLIGSIVKEKDENFAFAIHSNEHGNSQIYESSNYVGISQSEGATLYDVTIANNTNRWTISGAVKSEIISARERQRPFSILLGGIIFSLCISGLIYLLLLNRSRAFTEKEAKNLQEAKDELLALASHQLRTPATGVKQYLGMVLEGYAGRVPKAQKTLLERAFDSNERQLGIINEMLFVARIDAGNLKMQYKSIDILKIINNVIADQHSAIKERRQKLNTYLPNRRIIIEGDEEYLRMSIDNLVSNATKYTPDEGTITIRLKSHRDRVVVVIEDDGVGIDLDDEYLLFKKFSRIPNERTKHVNGTGMGLYLAKRVIDKHRGDIHYEPAARQGAVFVLTLPKKQPE